MQEELMGVKGCRRWIRDVGEGGPLRLGEDLLNFLLDV
jgi:hypothetical protein